MCPDDGAASPAAGGGLIPPFSLEQCKPLFRLAYQSGWRGELVNFKVIWRSSPDLKVVVGASVTRGAM